jgi:ATP-dependent HslUV protease ATP-binding subunit HslU
MPNPTARVDGSRLTPRQIVEELDRYIVGQQLAKRAVAVALRNSYRRECLQEALRDEVIPKNILMIGPTGVGKTEIARRLAVLAHAPFLKVEATKYTEVGYVGRDVESMIRDLVETAIRNLRAERTEQVRQEADEAALKRLLAFMKPGPRPQAPTNPMAALFGSFGEPAPTSEAPLGGSLTDEQLQYERAQLRSQVLSGALDDKTVELELEDTSPLDLPVMPSGGGEEMGLNIQEVLGSMLPRRKKTRTVTIREARRLLANEESAKLLDHEAIKRDAVKLAERQGIIFLDEIDKIASRERGGGGPEVSREGVQRDILPIVEGCTVMTKHGPVRTHHILFIAAGAFHVSKPSDLIPELQGRFPIRVELESLTEADFVRILTEPENALIKQYSALLATEGVEIEFTPEGIEQMAHLARRVNDTTENIGARRLHTMLEKVLEDLSFESPSETHQHVIIDAEYVRARLESIVLDEDLSRFVL